MRTVALSVGRKSVKGHFWEPILEKALGEIGWQVILQSFAWATL